MAKETILVVDDDPLMVDLLRLHLEATGYDVLCAPNGIMALAILTEVQPRVVICDWLMPKMDGVEVCNQVRKMHDQRMVYFIMLTVQSEKEHLMEAFDAGVDDFLAKPFHHGELLARVRAGARLVHMYDELCLRQAALAQSNSELCRLNERLKQAAITDDLTRLLNRRQAMVRLNELWLQFRKNGEPVSCAIIDVDHFKEINDNFGHLKGDEVLQRIATTLLADMRSGDCLYRLGGEEFLVLFPNEGIDSATACAERCRANVQATMAAGLSSGAITVSIGVAQATKEMTVPDQLLHAADLALYRAKDAGRNTVRPIAQVA